MLCQEIQFECFITRGVSDTCISRKVSVMQITGPFLHCVRLISQLYDSLHWCSDSHIEYGEITSVTA